MRIYNKWHFEQCPKYEMSYYIERIQKVGSDKAVKAFMSRLRKHYKGEEIMEEMKEIETKLSTQQTISTQA